MFILAVISRDLRGTPKLDYHSDSDPVGVGVRVRVTSKEIFGVRIGVNSKEIFGVGVGVRKVAPRRSLVISPILTH